MGFMKGVSSPTSIFFLVPSDSRSVGNDDGRNICCLGMMGKIFIQPRPHFHPRGQSEFHRGADEEVT